MSVGTILVSLNDVDRAKELLEVTSALAERHDPTANAWHGTCNLGSAVSSFNGKPKATVFRKLSAVAFGSP